MQNTSPENFGVKIYLKYHEVETDTVTLINIIHRRGGVVRQAS